MKNETLRRTLRDLLQKALNQIGDNDKGLYDLIEKDVQFTNKLAQAVSKCYDVYSFFEIDEIFGYIDDTQKRLKPDSADDWLSWFDENYSINKVRCYSIAPVDSPILFTSCRSDIKKPIRVFDFLITPVYSSQEKLTRSLKNLTGGFEIQSRLIQHLITKTSNALLNNNLMILSDTGTYQSIKRITEQKLTSARVLFEILAVKQSAYERIGETSGNSLVLEYRPCFKSIQYSWVNQIEDFKFTITKSIIKEANSQLFLFMYNYLNKRSSNKFKERLHKVLRLFSKGFNERENLERFIFYIIALEALFCTDRNTPIRTTLADYVSVLIESPAKRLDTHKRIKKLYDIRSNLFHSGQSVIDEKSVDDLQSYLVRTLIEIFRIIKEKEPSSEEAFQDRILKMKIGAV